MDQLWQFCKDFLEVSDKLKPMFDAYLLWIYVGLFVVVFCETGFVVTPFLPGDSLLFAAGAFAGLGWINPLVLFVLLAVAAIAGDTVNYWIGNRVGPKIFHKENVRFLNKEHLNRAHKFYETYGGITIVVARFMPIIRTFAPFVAGIGSMTYWRFLLYNIVGGMAWVAGFVFLGYFIGGMEIVRKHITLLALAIVIISVLPLVIGYLRRHKTQPAPSEAGQGAKTE